MSDLFVTLGKNRPAYRPATPAELVEAVSHIEGAEQRETAFFVDGDGRFTVSVSKPGRYLVVPVSEEPNQ